MEILHKAETKTELDARVDAFRKGIADPDAHHMTKFFRFMRLFGNHDMTLDCDILKVVTCADGCCSIEVDLLALADEISTLIDGV